MTRHTFRYVVDDEPGPGAEVALAAADAHHLTRVVRRGPGDAVELIDRAGRIWPATVLDGAPVARVRLGDAPRPAPGPAPVTLLQGLTEWGRLDTLVEKCTELGVGEVAFLLTARTRRAPHAEAWGRRRERLGRVAEAAARQAGAPPPALGGLVRVAEALAAPGDAVLLDPSGDRALTAHLAARPDPAAPLRLLVGPDAGWSRDEVDAARRSGVPVGALGHTVLRAETAGLVAVTLALAAAGRLGRDDDPDPEDG